MVRLGHKAASGGLGQPSLSHGRPFSVIILIGRKTQDQVWGHGQCLNWSEEELTLLLLVPAGQVCQIALLLDITLEMIIWILVWTTKSPVFRSSDRY